MAFSAACIPDPAAVDEWYDDQPGILTADLVPVTQGEKTGGIDAAIDLCPDFDGDTICDGADLDDDNDGCTDEQEMGPSAASGGARNPKYFWDFFDVPTGSPPARDMRVTIGDVGAVVARFGTFRDPAPSEGEALIEALTAPLATGYHTAFDRSPPEQGADVWDAGPPDGTITIGDIGAAVAQFGHTCVVAP